MPELPDVEVFRRRLDAAARGRRVEALRAVDPAILGDELSPQGLGRRLKRRGLGPSRRHGKNLFTPLAEGGGWLRWHFGMTGEVIPVQRGEGDPRHTRARLELDGGTRLAFVSRRKLARLGWVEDADAWVEAHELGPDALALDDDGFRTRLEGRGGSIKGALMNQSLLAGIGNVYADEALFQARVHPSTPITDLPPRALGALHQALQRVLREAIDAGVRDFPDHFLVPHRAEGEPCPRCGEALERTEVVGRATYLCPREQPAP